MEDISPKLLQRIKSTFNAEYATNQRIRVINQRIEAGTATLEDAQEFSSQIGRCLGIAFKRNITEGTLPDDKLYWNIAEKVVAPLIKNNYELINANASDILRIINKSTRIGLSPQKADIPEERLKGLLDFACAAQGYEEIGKRLNEPVRNISESFFDDFVYANASFRDRAGLKVTVTRLLGGRACEWCRNLAGVYDYSEVKEAGSDVWRRHENCRCQIIWTDGKRTDLV